MEVESAESWESGWRRRARLLMASDFLDRYVPRSVDRETKQQGYILTFYVKNIQPGVHIWFLSRTANCST